MANWPITAGNFAVHDKTLVAATVDTVTIADAMRAVEILSDGTAAIYFTADGTAPAVSGGRTYKIPAGAVSAVIVPVSGAGAVIKLISAGTPTYSVVEAA